MKTRARNGRVIHTFPAKTPEKATLNGKKLILSGYNEIYHPDTKQGREGCDYCTPPAVLDTDYIISRWRSE